MIDCVILSFLIGFIWGVICEFIEVIFVECNEILRFWFKA